MKYNPVIENMSRAELLQVQWTKLKYLLDHLWKNNLYFQRRFVEIGITPADINSMEDFRRKIPLMSKKDLIKCQEEDPPYGTRLGVAKNKLVRTHMTSGTSGSGQEAYGMTRSDAEYMGCWTTLLYASGVRRGDICFNVLPTSVGHLAAGDSITHSFIKAGVNHIHLGPFTAQQKIDLMIRFQPVFMWTVPAFLTRLTVLCEENGIDPRRDIPSFKSICIATAPFTIEWAQDMESFWGCKLVEMYGITNVGTLGAFTCEDGVVPGGQRGYLHLREDILITEVLDRETREPVGPGEVGELVLTTLGREASPTVRYATNDRVTYLPYDGCSCGRPFDALESGTITRYDDMIKMKGANVWPEAVEEVLFEGKEVDEYQGRVYIDEQGREQVVLTVEFRSNLPQERKQQILAFMPEKIRTKVDVTMKLVETSEPLPRSDFKVRRWTDERLKGKQAN